MSGYQLRRRLLRVNRLIDRQHVAVNSAYAYKSMVAALLDKMSHKYKARKQRLEILYTERKAIEDKIGELTIAELTEQKQ